MINLKNQKNLRGTLIFLLALISVTALGAGYGFMTDPSGHQVGFTVAYLQFSPFKDFFWPGLILFSAIGLFSALTLFATIAGWQKYPQLIFYCGVVLCGWILIQIMLVRDFNLLHLMCLIIGVAFMASARRIMSR